MLSGEFERRKFSRKKMSNFAALFVIFQNRNILAFAENQCYNSVILLGNLHIDLQIFLHYVYYVYKRRDARGRTKDK